ncbi:ATP-binding protein [Bernardetia sp.]|uniref:ATP-binding protein n=1 Tax=Bernardetia sp. TaxID=1937974 RepID=UPI0025BCBA75|nr:ATP-binding protein [Bernardetia sp.]
MSALTKKELKTAIENCAKEPIHHLGHVQPHGFLIVFSDDMNILGISENLVEKSKLSFDELVGKCLSIFLGERQTNFLEKKLQPPKSQSKSAFFKTINPLRLFLELEGEKKPFDGIVHQSNHGCILELEPIDLESGEIKKDNFYQISKKSIIRFQHSDNLKELYTVIVEEIQHITGFDRVMLYKFNEEYDGQIVAEVKLEEMNPFYDLWFPSTDIPKQARELYLKNWLRLISDTHYIPSPILLKDDIKDTPLDLTYSTLRSVSPVHIEYLKNMGVEASMSISIIVDGKLWGLVSCHHNSAKYVDYSTRMTAEFFAQLVSLQIDRLQKNELQLDKLEKQTLTEGIIESLKEEKNVYGGMIKKGKSFLKLLDADGVVVLVGADKKKIFKAGITPIDEQIWQMKDWLEIHHSKDLFSSHCLSKDVPEIKLDETICSGALSVPISKEDDSRIIWFREELQQSINWGGKLEKIVLEKDNELVLKPRNSFAKWNQKVECQSKKWTPSEIEAAKSIQSKIFYVVTQNMNEYREELRRKELEQQVRIRTEELTTINEKLGIEINAREEIAKKLKEGMQLLEVTNKELEHFAYVASHDLQEPLRAIASFSQLLEKRYEGQLDEKAAMYIRFIIEGAGRMKDLIMDLLEYSRLHRNETPHKEVQLNDTYQNAIQNLTLQIEETKAEIEIENDFSDIKIMGNSSKLTQLFQNLVGNAIKYRSEATPQIKITYKENKDHFQFTISDNGIGIDPRFADRIFIIFQRLHTKENYEGTGIGLALCQKIVEQHKGKIWLDQEKSQSGKGTTIHFTLGK